mmetsp:Transcript_4132/g.6994  ORF Transcript_4132/g.6994 Transcript_4132/m.6994 type:complete len:94 (+) Transcript_4132:1057-1338(+)
MAGDLLLTLKVKEHELLRRQGQHLFSVVPMSLSQAILGASITIDTAYGKLSININEGSQDGDRIRLANYGVEPFRKPDNYDPKELRGDHIIHL